MLTSYEERIERSSQLFEWIATEKLKIASSTTFSLQDGARAHELLESRKAQEDFIDPIIVPIKRKLECISLLPF